ncbi:MAG: ABC transporter permease [Bacteroidetes bacterium]|nr:ABC transporter permease [Bacteroidota bacterium]
MNSRVLLKIAKTHLLARKRQSAIAALGVTFGIGTFVILVSFMTGLNNLLDGLLMNRTPHIRVYNEIKPSALQPAQLHTPFKDAMHVIHSVKPRNTLLKIHNARALMDALRRDSRIKGVTPQVASRVFYASGSVRLNGTVTGIDALNESRLYNFHEYVLQGKPQDLEHNDNGIILGIGVARKLSIAVGDYVQLIGTAGNVVRLKVEGFFQSGLADIDNVQSYVNVKTAQRLAGESASYITDLSIKLYDVKLAPSIAADLRRRYGFNAIDLQKANAQFETGTKVRNMITYAVSITLLVVAGFGIYNILNMLIYEKMNDIAILKATGFSGGDVKRIFLYQAMLIGAVGGVLGLVMGFLVSVGIDNAPFETEALPTIKTFPVNFDPKYYIIGTVFSLATTLLAGYMPARKASKIDPVEIIRGQ